MWQRQIQWPLCLGTRIDEGGGLWIVDYRKLRVESEAGAILFVVPEKNLEALVGQVIRPAVQRVVESLRHRKKVVAAGHHVPANGEIELQDQRHNAIQHFGHAAAHRGRIHHLNRPSLQGSGERAQFRNLARADDGSVIVEMDRRVNGLLGVRRNRIP